MVNGPRWIEGAPTKVPARAVLLAPHPDDETLGYAGIMRWLLDRSVDCTIVAVTDGEASHPTSAAVAPPELVEIRRDERRAALEAIGASHVAIERLGLPDGAVDRRVDELVAAVRARVDSSTCVVVPWRGDAHPDHMAVAHAGAAATSGANDGTLWEVPIWGRVHGVNERCSVLALGSFLARKIVAAGKFHSQIQALGPGADDGPVLRPSELRAFLQPTELVVMR